MESMTFRAGFLRPRRLRFTHPCGMINIEAKRRRRGVPHGPERLPQCGLLFDFIVSAG